MTLEISGMKGARVGTLMATRKTIARTKACTQRTTGAAPLPAEDDDDGDQQEEEDEGLHTEDHKLEDRRNEGLHAADH